MALYEELREVDVLGPVEHLLGKELVLTEKGKLIPAGRRVVATDVPWQMIKLCQERNCSVWLGFYFKYYRIIPKACFSCYKVVAFPRTLEELFDVRVVHYKLGIPGKVGIERRKYATYGGRYRAFWYCPLGRPFEHAQDIYRRVKAAVHEYVGEGVKVILKRACTEMEMGAGPTNEWEYPKEQELYERLLDSVYRFPKHKEQPTVFVKYLEKLWIEYGFECGDPTVGKFVDKYPESFGVRPAVTYGD